VTTPIEAVAVSLIHAVVWWLALAGVSAIGWLAMRPAVSAWHDRGWAIARPLSLLAFAYAVWVVAHALPAFGASVIQLVLAACAFAVLAWRRRSLTLDRGCLRAIAASEARFVLPFAFYVAMRGFSHDVIGLEKFMDYAFAASAMRADTLPVPDPWFAGEPINYYYFGHYVTAFLCKLSATPLAFGYNLMLATVFASVFQLAFAFVAEMTRSIAPATRSAMGYLAATWLTIGGNVHGFFYGFVKPWLVDAGLVERPRQAFLLSDPTRFVGWDPPTSDKLIHEFPAYAFYVGDLHAHLINLPWVLAFCCVLLAWLRAKQASTQGRDVPSATTRAASERMARGWLFVAAWLTGLFAMSNAWDGLMYVVVLAALLVVSLAASLRRGARAAGRAVADALLAGTVSVATTLPFLVNFDAHSQGFFATYSHTPLRQWLVLYGLHAGLALAGCHFALRRDSRVDRAERTMLVTLTAFGIAFALVPEFVYLKDIYGGPFYRGNTAFKFGFQAFTLLTLAASVAVALAVSAERVRIPRAAIAILFEIALVPPLYYAWFVLQGAFGVWREREWTLDGQRYLANNYPEDQAAARWLEQNARPGTSLVEAVGDSYTYAARISTNSGVPALLGWPVHEQLWRGSDPLVWRRRDDVNALYAATTITDAQRIIDRYHPRWLIVGGFERERYGTTLDTQLLASLGTVTFRAGTTFVVDLAGEAGVAPLAGAAGVAPLAGARLCFSQVCAP
jgi:uncharacterized membrane protein